MPSLSINADGTLNKEDLKSACVTTLHEMFPPVEKMSTKKARMYHSPALDFDSLLAPPGHGVTVGAQLVLARVMSRTMVKSLDAIWAVRV